MDTFFDEKNKPTTMQLVGGLAVTALTIFAIVYVTGRAWKKSQTA
jgi:hypothetical protein